MPNATQEIYDDLFQSYPDGVLDKRDDDPVAKADADRIDAINRPRVAFFDAVRHLLISRFRFNPKAPRAPRLPCEDGDDRDILHGLNVEQKKYFVGVAGTLLARNHEDPLEGRRAELMSADETERDLDGGPPFKIARQFVQATVQAVATFNDNPDVYRRVFEVLQGEGTNGKIITVYARQVAEVTARLVEQRIPADDAQFEFQVRNALAQSLRGNVDGRSSQVDIELIDLEEGAQAEILAPNVKALSAIYCAAMLEELKFFAVADKLAEQFTQGMLPVTRGPGGEYLYRFIRDAINRMTEVERRSLYARCFGVAQGSVEESLPNREFTDLWIRFLSAVSFRNKEQTSTERKLSSEPQVAKSARDLAVNISLHGYGLAHFAAVELQKLIKDVKQMLSSRDVLEAWGVKDCWQLTERISASYLGGSVNSVRQRTMAQSGMYIIQWLADNNNTIASGAATVDLNNPAGLKLIEAVDSWLAVTGTDNTTVQRYSEPVTVQTQRTIPDFSPQSMMPDFQAAFDKMGAVPAPALTQG